MAKQTLLGVAAGSVLSPGSMVGGRFLCESLTTMFGTIIVYSARDQKTQRPVSLWMVPPGVLAPEIVEATRKAIRGAAAVAHKDLVVPFGSSLTADGSLCVATEVLGPTSVADLIDRKRRDGAVHAISAAYPLVAHVTNALTVAHASLAHGAVAPNLVRIDAKGRVKLAGLGMLTPLLAMDAVRACYVAPEVRRGASPSPQSDIYSVGAILYELLTGQSPNPEVPPSSLVPGLAPTLDIIVESCLAEQPQDRFESASALKGALAALVAPTERPPPNELLDIDIELDLDADPSTATPHEPRPVTLAPGLRVSAVVSTGSGQNMSTPASAPGAPKELGLRDLLQHATANDADRWMFVHGGLDHGPLTARALIEAIARGEVEGGDPVINMDTQERKKLLDWPQYRDFAETAQEKRQREQRKALHHEAIRDEGLKTRSKLVVAAAAVVAVAAVGGVYYKTLGPGARRGPSAAEIDDLVARGQIRVQTQSIQLLPPPPPSPHRSHGSGGGSGGSSGSYESAMSAPIDYNFSAGGGSPSGGTLSDAEIMRPLNASLGRFAGCLADGSARHVTLRIAIGGNGRAIGVTVNNGSGAVRSCVASVVRSLGWRAFGGPRIGLSWGFGF